MIIRKFQPNDLHAVLKLFYDVVHTVGAKYYAQEEVTAWAPDNPDKDKWLHSLTTNYTYIAEDKGKIIGFGDMTERGYIDRLYVHKDYQGKGIASAILKKLEEEALRLHLKELTTEANIIAKKVALRQGFEIIEKYQKMHKGVEFTLYKMRKKL